MKRIFIYICLFISSGVHSQAPGVLDSRFISERHHTFIDHIDIGGEIWDDIFDKFRNNQLSLTKPEDSLFLTGHYSGFYPSRIGIPYLHLFHEDDHWAVRTFKTVDLETSYQGIFWEKGPARHRYYREEDRSLRTDTVFNEHGIHIFKEIVQKGIELDRITPYINMQYDYILDNSYHLDSNARDSIAQLIPLCNKIVIKEDYYYNKYTGTTGSQIIALGFFHNDQTLVWTYYPELSYSLRNNFLFFDHDLNLQLNTTFDEVFKDHFYDIESLSLQPLRINNWRWNDFRKEESDLVHLTDIDALFYVDLVQSYIEANYRNYSGKVEMSVHNNLVLQTTLESGQIQGECKLLSKDKNLRIQINFKNHIANGDYFEYYENGELKETGKFETGLKEGLWTNFFKGGEKMGHRNYSNGWLEGQQKFWYQNGTEYIVFYYENFMLNGPFVRYNPEGSISEKGYFTDNYPDKKWTINLHLPQQYVSIVQSNKDLDWLYPTETYSDGILSYKVELEQGPKLKECPTPIFTCVSLKEMSTVE